MSADPLTPEEIDEADLLGFTRVSDYRRWVAAGRQPPPDPEIVEALRRRAEARRAGK